MFVELFSVVIFTEIVQCRQDVLPVCGVSLIVEFDIQKMERI